jgi:hypothetical protein
LICTIFSEIFAPRKNDLVEMLKNNLADHTPQAWRALYSYSSMISKRSANTQYLHSAPPFHSVNVHWLVSLIRLEEQPPGVYVKNGRHESFGLHSSRFFHRFGRRSCICFSAGIL